MSVTRRTGVTVKISASHQLERGSPCAHHLHGHEYTITVWTSATIVPLWNSIQDVIGELDLRHLNDMVPAGEPTVLGLATYLGERLAMLGVDEVEVYESGTNLHARVSR